MIEAPKKRDDDSSPELSAIGTPERTFDDPLEVAEYLQEKAMALCDEAMTYGFPGVVIMSGFDPIDKVANRVLVRRGNYYEIIGMLVDAQFEMQHETSA